MSAAPTLTAFLADRLLAAGPAPDVALAVRRTVDAGAVAPILVFDDRTGRQLDLDLRGSEAEVAVRHATPATDATPDAPRAPGRPRLGVVAREVTLLPRHWEWLAEQPGGASATLRRLVDAARKLDDGAPTRRTAQQAADRVMLALLGDQPGYEEASRALYAGDRALFDALTDPWPTARRDYARRLAAPAFDGTTAEHPPESALAQAGGEP